MQGDIVRMTPSGLVYASLWDWSRFFVYRGFAAFVEGLPGCHSEAAWHPVCGSWDQLEDDLLERFGSVTARWYPPTSPPRWTCLVCKDAQALGDGRGCPACHPTPVQGPITLSLFQEVP